MLPQSLRLALVLLQGVAGATLLRSVAYDRWITVLASTLLLVGAAASHRGKTWGIALTFAQAVAFPVAWWIGIAPPWFCLVGLVGVLPFVLTARAFARFDAKATALLAGLGATAGALGAVAWKAVAWDVFAMFPFLRPSVEAQHGLLLGTLLVLGAIATRGRRRELAEPARVRIGEGVRVAEEVDLEAEMEAESETSSAPPSADADYRRSKKLPSARRATAK